MCVCLIPASLRRAVARCPELLRRRVDDLATLAGHRERVTLSRPRWRPPVCGVVFGPPWTRSYGAERPHVAELPAATLAAASVVARLQAGEVSQVLRSPGAACPGSYSYRRSRPELVTRGAVRPGGIGYGAAVSASRVAARIAARAARYHRPDAERVGGCRHGRRTQPALHRPSARLRPGPAERGLAGEPGQAQPDQVPSSSNAHSAERPRPRPALRPADCPLEPRKRALLMRSRLRRCLPRVPFSAR